LLINLVICFKKI